MNAARWSTVGFLIAFLVGASAHAQSSEEPSKLKLGSETYFGVYLSKPDGVPSDGYHYKGSLLIGDGKLFNASAYTPIQTEALGFQCDGEAPYAYSVKEKTASIYCMDLSPEELAKHDTQEIGKSRFTYRVRNKNLQKAQTCQFDGWKFTPAPISMNLEPPPSGAAVARISSKTKPGTTIGNKPGFQWYAGTIVVGSGKIDPFFQPAEPVEGFTCDAKTPYLYASSGAYYYCMDVPYDQFSTMKTSNYYEQKYKLLLYDPEKDVTTTHQFEKSAYNPPKPPIKFEPNPWVVSLPGPVTAPNGELYIFQGNLKKKPEKGVPLPAYDCGEDEAYAVKVTDNSVQNLTYVYCFAPGFRTRPLSEAAQSCVEKFRTTAPKKFGAVRVPKGKTISRSKLVDCTSFIENRLSKELDQLEQGLWPALLATLEMDAYFSGEPAERAVSDFCAEAVTATQTKGEALQELMKATLVRGERDRPAPPSSAKDAELATPSKVKDRYYGDLENPFKLSVGEFEGIRAYTGSDYGQLNAALRTGNFKTPDDKKRVDFIRSGLPKLPTYQGVVRRFSELPPDALKAHEPGAVIEYSAFTSTSKKEDWNWHGNHRFLIYSAHGKNVESLSSNAGEEEVLFDAGTRFKILDVHQNGKIQEFILKEVP